MNDRRRSEVTAAGWCLLYAIATFTWYVVWRNRFAERSADEAIFENLLWNGVHGHGLRTWTEAGGVPHLAVHFSPVLYLLMPLYAAFPSMHVVHLVASILTALAGFLFYRHAARILDQRAALPAMLAFLLCPTLLLQTFMEFHEQALAILPITLLLAAWSEERWTTALLAATGLLTVREDNALLVMMLGAVSLFMARRRAAGASMLALGAAWLVAWRLVAVQLLGGGHLPGIFGGTYSQWGETPGQVVRSVATQPVAVLRHLIAPVPIRYLVLLLAPVLGVLPFGSPLVLVMLPQLLMVLLAGYDTRMFQIRMHFSVAPMVVLFFAAIETLGRLQGSSRPPAALARRWAPAGMLAVGLLLAPGWAVRAVARLNPFSAQIREVLAALPDTASVTAPGYLLNHLAARRQFALEWNDDIRHTEYVVLEDSSRFFFKGTTVDIFYSPHFDSLLTAGGYRRVLDRHGWHVYRRGGGAAGGP